MTLDQTVQVVQVSFPQIYLACHSRHQRKRSNTHQLSQRDASILAHLDQRVGTVPSTLARHLGIARSTLSEALKRLTALGYVSHVALEEVKIGRTSPVLLTLRGARSIQDTSVLETQQLRRALEALNPKDLETVRFGMERLAAACRELSPSVITEESA